MKCIVNGKILFKDRIADDMVIVYDEKIERLLMQRI